jgi:hypothetical protein
MKMPKESSVSSTMRGRCYIDWQRHVSAVIGCYALVQTALRRSFLPLDLLADVSTTTNRMPSYHLDDLSTAQIIKMVGSVRLRPWADGGANYLAPLTDLIGGHATLWAQALPYARARGATPAAIAAEAAAPFSRI